MAEDTERRGERTGSRRRDAARSMRPASPLIETEATRLDGPAKLDEAAKPADAGTPAETAAFEASEMRTAPEIIAEPVAAEPPASVVEEAQPSAAGPAGEPLISEAAAPAAETEPPARPYAEPRLDGGTTRDATIKRPSIVPALAALVFAILAAGWIYLYNQLAAVQADGRVQVADVQARVAALEARPQPDTAGLNKRIDTVASQGQDAVQALSRRVDALPRTSVDTKPIEALQAQGAALQKQATDVEKQQGDLQKLVGGLQTQQGETQKQQSDFQKQVSALQASVAALPRVEQRIGDADGRLNALQATVAAIPRIDLGPLTGKVDAIEARMKPIEAETQAAASPQRVAERRAAPVAVTAQAIVEQIAAGQAFPREVAALQVLGTDPAKLAPLQAVAATGAPSLHDLQASLAELRDRIVAQGAPKPTGSYMDRLMAGASTLVQVKPTGSVVGDTPAAVVSRINEAIGSDDLARALHEWDGLPEPSRDVSKGVADRIRMRLRAEEAAKAIAANAIGAMAQPGG